MIVQSRQAEFKNKTKMRAAGISLLVSIFVFGIKFFAYLMSDSSAIFSDALESIVNVLASGVALLVVRFVAQPADADHPYGHGKMEFFSSAFEGGLIFFAAIVVSFEAIMSLIHRSPLNHLGKGIVIISIAGLINLALGLYLRWEGQRCRSATLEASGAHVISDVWTTCGVLVGLALVSITGITWLDPLVALLVAGHLGVTGVFIVRGSVGALIDEQDPKVLSDLCEAFEKNRKEGVIEIHQLKMIRSGSFHHIDAHLVVPEFWDVATCHKMMEDFERDSVRDYPFEGEIAFHVDPCMRRHCEHCDYEPCPVRQSKFIERETFDVKRMMEGPHD